MKLRNGKQLPQNSYVTLPPELLSGIFVACADPPYAEQEPSYWLQSRSMQWITITHVCRYWRSVALGYSDLWKRLRFFNPDVTKEMIRRSKGANLEVIFDHSASLQVLQPIAESNVVPMLLPELHRVSVLHLAYPNLLQSLVDGFVSAAPKLEYLCLSLSSSMKVFHIPDTIFSRETPALRSLELHNCTFTSPSPSSSTMSSPDSRIGRIPSTTSQIVSFLRGAPMLHTLILDRVLPFVETDDAYSNLVLPKLSRLQLTSSVASCTNFLEHIIFPVTTDTSISCIRIPPQASNFGRLFRALFSVNGDRNTNFVISALTFRVMFGICYIIHCTITHSHQPAPTNVTFKFFTKLSNREFFRDIFNTASVTLPLTNAHELDIVGYGTQWPLIGFDSLPNIHTIHFKTMGHPLGVVRAALAANEHFHRLRSLHSLQFSNMEFSDEDISTLMDDLKHRLRSGFPIECIRLRTCSNLKKADVMRMKEFVQDVEWDGAKY